MEKTKLIRGSVKSSSFSGRTNGPNGSVNVRRRRSDLIEMTTDRPALHSEPKVSERKSISSLFTTLKRKFTLRRKKNASSDTTGNSGSCDAGGKCSSAAGSRNNFGRRSLRSASRPVAPPLRPTRSEESLNTPCSSSQYRSTCIPPTLPPRNPKPSHSKQDSSNVSKDSVKKDSAFTDRKEEALGSSGKRPPSTHASTNLRREAVVRNKCISQRSSGAEVAANKVASKPSVPSRKRHSLSHVKQNNIYAKLKHIPKKWSLTKELFKLSHFGWYWGPITIAEAQDILFDLPDGSFLVRDSSDERYLLTISFRSYDRTLHTRIEQYRGIFSFYAQPDSDGYRSVAALVQHSISKSQNGVLCYARGSTQGSIPYPVRLAKPVSRFNKVRSLQSLCRFVIRLYTRIDHIQKLPLPTVIKGWLEENQY